MREFLVSVTLVSLITSLSLMIMPEGGLKKYVKLALSLVFCAFVISSFTGGNAGNISLPSVQVQDRTDEFYESVLKKTKENTEKNLRDAIIKKFSVSENDIEVSVQLSGTPEALKLENVHIRLYGIKNTVKLTAVKKYAEGLLDTQVTAEYAE